MCKNKVKKIKKSKK